jgi:hypothetical protein
VPLIVFFSLQRYSCAACWLARSREAEPVASTQRRKAGRPWRRTGTGGAGR